MADDLDSSEPYPCKECSMVHAYVQDAVVAIRASDLTWRPQKGSVIHGTGGTTMAEPMVDGGWQQAGIGIVVKENCLGQGVPVLLVGEV